MKRKGSWSAAIAAILTASLWAAATTQLGAQEPEGEVVPPERFASPDASGVEALALAEELVEYGIRAESPEALVAAARIILNTPMSGEEIPVEARETGQRDAEDEKPEDEGIPRLNVNEILAAASEMVEEGSHLQEVIEDLKDAPRARGAVGGPKYGVFRVEALSYNDHLIRFEGNRQAVVAVKGDGDTDLDCVALNMRGYRVASDTRNVDECLLRFWPNQTATYRIRVLNWGFVYNEYELLTN